MIIVGIDPGLAGGISILDTNPPSSTFTGMMPLTGKMIDVRKIRQAIDSIWFSVPNEEVSIFIEKVHSMPGQGVASTFKFGTGFGQLIGMCQALDLKHMLVPPQTWKKVVLTGTKKDKDSAVEFVRSRYPHIDLTPGRLRVPHIGIADAVCIMEYGRRLEMGAV